MCVVGVTLSEAVTSCPTFGGDGLALPGAHSDGGGLGQVGAGSPHPDLHVARALVHRVLQLPEVQRGLWGSRFRGAEVSLVRASLLLLLII